MLALSLAGAYAVGFVSAFVVDVIARRRAGVQP